MAGLADFLPKMPTAWPTKFDTGPASIDGAYAAPPVAPPAGFVMPARPATAAPAPYAATPTLANPAGGLPQAPSAMANPDMVADQLRPYVPPGPGVVKALGAGAGVVAPAAAPVAVPASVQAAVPTGMGLMSPQRTPGAVGSFGAPAAAPAGGGGIDVLRGSHMSYGEGGGNNGLPPGMPLLTPRDARALMATAQPRISPVDQARQQMLYGGFGQMQNSMAKSKADYDALVAAAQGNPAKLKEAEDIRRNTEGGIGLALIKQLSSIGNAPLNEIQNLVPPQGMPET